MGLPYGEALGWQARWQWCPLAVGPCPLSEQTYEPGCWVGTLVFPPVGLTGSKLRLSALLRWLV